MGQYFCVYNTTKKEFINPHALGLGAKLMEQYGFAGSTADAVFLLLANSIGDPIGDPTNHHMNGRWAGDCIVVQGDYAEKHHPGFVDDFSGYTDISAEVADMLSVSFD